MLLWPVTIVVLITSVARASQVSTDDVLQWLQYKAKYGRTYSNSDEEWRRFKIFLSNKDFVEDHNYRYDLGEFTFTVALNRFADMTNEEFGAQFRHCSNPGQHGSPTNAASRPAHPAKIPTAVDWRRAGAVTEVSDQGQCESGWAFSSAGAIEALHKQTTGGLVKLSAQQLVDCTPDVDPCHEGHAKQAFDYIIACHGIDTDVSYPYTTNKGDCMANVSVVGANMTTYKRIVKGDETDLTEAVAISGPIAVEIDATHVSFQFYSGGVYYEKDCQTEILNHGVLVVGYGSLNGTNYYIVKNSWGTTWGQHGYINMARNGSNNCGIASVAFYPVL